MTTPQMTPTKSMTSKLSTAREPGATGAGPPLEAATHWPRPAKPTPGDYPLLLNSIAEAYSQRI